MFEVLILFLFCWLFVGAVRLAFRVTWSLAKVAAVILFAAALPLLVVLLVMAGGLLLLVPLALLGIAVAILKACC